MEYGSSIFSLLFFIAFCIYLYWGVYIIRINPKGGVNRVFLATSISLCIWSLGYGMTNTALDMESALLWRRFSAIGRMSLFSLVLHFMLLLANKDVSVKQRKLFMLVHIPALITMYIFAFSNTMSIVQYNMMKINLGWVNIPTNNGWDYLYYIYYSLYIISSLIIVGKWKKEFKSQLIIKQARLFFITFIGALIVGTFTDLVLSSILKNPLPQMTPLFVLLPVWAMYYSARYYNVLTLKKVKKEEIFVFREQKKQIVIIISMAISLSGVLSFSFRYFSDTSGKSGDLSKSIINAMIIITFGLSIFFAQKIEKESLKDFLTTVALIMSVPIVAYQFLDYSTITVWVFPIIIIISSLLFNKRFLLIGTTIIAIITQRLVWIIRPESYVLVDKYDFILRILILMIVFSLGSYINRIYISKLKENEDQIEFQKMVSDVSFEFLTLKQENFDEKINMLLGKIGNFFHVDRTYMFTIDHNNDTMTYSNEWCNQGIHEEVGTIEAIPLEVFPWWIDQLIEKKLVYIEDVDVMPEKANAEQEQLHRQEVKSLVSIPVMIEEKLQAFIGIDSVLSKKKWDKENIELLDIMGNILASGISQINADKKIEFMAYYDDLTKLPNRFLFEDRVNQAINLSKRTKVLIGVIFIDLDGFKSVNDTIGHRGGDILLNEVALSLTRVTGETDIVARFGGDEFMIMTTSAVDDDMVTKTTDKIMKIFSESFSVNEQEFFMTASAGVSVYPTDGEEAETLIKNADIAMYKAKAKGKNQYALCTKEMKDEVKSTMVLSNDLHYALEKNELIVYYQPQIDLMTKKITGVEALIRWMHPEKGMISPGVFIPIAEQNSLINSIGEWVFKTACLQIKKWQDMGLPFMDIAINLSALQIIDPKITTNLERIIKETRLDPKYIEVEITESIALEETSYVIEVLNNLKSIGVSIAIDDFGTEYSSLSRLKLLPIDRIKIDMQFVQGIESNEKDKAITMVIINLAKSLGLNVIAEGVETDVQLKFLDQKKCDDVQGYYYYKPMPSEEFEEILKSMAKENNQEL